MKRNEIIYKTITHPLFVFPLIFIMLLMGNAGVPLIDQDESAYALIGSSMAETGDYINQMYLWTDIHRKPPMHMWFISFFVKLFGNHEFAIRFSTSLFSWGTLLLIYWYGRAMYHERIATSAAIICGTCFLFPVYGKIAFTDGTLLFFETWAAFSLVGLMQWKKYIHIIMFWVAIAFGILVKGPSILIFIGIFGFLTLILNSNRRRLLRTHPWFYLPLVLLPIVYWGYQYWQRDDGETISWMLDWYVFKRGSGDVVVEGQTGPPGYYLLVFAFAFIPYFRYFLPALWEGIKGLFLRRKNPELLMLSLWMVSGWWIYEFIPSKLPSYALASLPAISILMAHEMIQLSDRRIISTGLKTLTVLEILMTLGLTVLAYFFSKDYLGKDAALMVTMTVAFLPLASITSFIQQLRKHFTLSIYFHLIFVGLFWLTASFFIYPKLGKYWNGPKKVAQMISEEYATVPDTIFIDHFKGKPCSVPYYLKKYNDVEEVYVVSGWFDALNRYQSENPFLGVVLPASKDTLSAFIQTEYDYVHSHRLDRKEQMGFYILDNGKLEK